MSGQNKIWLVVISGFVGGVWLRSFLLHGFTLFLLFLLLAVTFGLYAWWLTKNVARKNVLIIALFCLIFGLGILRLEVSEIQPVKDSLSAKVGQTVKLQGVVVTEPAVNEAGQKIQVEVGEGASTSNKILVKTGLYPTLNYGDLLEVKGKLLKPQNFGANDESERFFDYVSYLNKDDIHYEIDFAGVRVLAQDQGSWLTSRLLQVKNSFITQIEERLPAPESQFLGGLLLGAKSAMGDEWRDRFARSGVSHTIALSGYNITIVADSLMRFFSFLPGPLATSIGVLGIIFFALMTGAGATVVRATIMALLVVVARTTGRNYDMTRALLLAGCLMVLQNPKILVFDLSFQLSFLATLALIYVSPMLIEHFHFVPQKFQLRELFVSTLATQIFVTPFILYKIGLFSLVALPVNLLILPFIPMTMLFGFLTGLANYFFVYLAWLLALVAKVLLSFELFVVSGFAAFPYAAVTIKYFPLGLLIFSYGVIGFFIIRFEWRIRQKQTILLESEQPY